MAVRPVALLFLLLVCAVGATAVAAEQSDQAFDRRRNVLFIAVDDLRPALGCYGDQTAITPHIDEIAASGVLFRRAYCQQAVCSPSRLSLITGLRPDTIRVWDLKAHFRDARPNTVTLPQYLQQHGYQTVSVGKVLHGSGPPSADPESWSEPAELDRVRDPRLRYALAQNLQGTGLKRAASEAADVADNVYIDGLVCDTAIQKLSTLRDMNQPFFLAVGFRKPHLPFCAPQRYWDLYNRSSIPVPTVERHPERAPEWAIRSWGELEGYTDITTLSEITPDKQQELRHGYYACVSYLDALVGRLMHELKRLGLDQSTMVVLWGDHGFHLGEQGLWTKANNFELATRVPLIVSGPGITVGGEADGLVELVDVFPTVVELCNLEIPPGVEGVSLRPLLEHPLQPWKQAAFSQFPRARAGRRHQGSGDIMGYTVRTEHYRYVEWREGNTNRVLARELYDHLHDPHESRNVIGEDRYQAEAVALKRVLNAGWARALPTSLSEQSR